MVRFVVVKSSWVVILGFRTLLAIPGRPSDESNQYARFSHRPISKPLGLLRFAVFKMFQPFWFHVKINFRKGFPSSQTLREFRCKLRHSPHLHVRKDTEDKRKPIGTSKKQFAFTRHKTGEFLFFKVFMISFEQSNNTSRLDRSSDGKLKYGYQVCRTSPTKGVLELEKLLYNTIHLSCMQND